MAARRGATTGGSGIQDPRQWMAKRRAPQIATEPLEDELGADDEGSWLDTGVSTALRVVPSIVGGVGGAAVGNVPGALAGGAAGGGFGEWLAQQYERYRGLRDETNYGSVAVETALGAIPLKKSATLLSAAAKGAGMGVAGGVGHSLAETGELPSAGQVATSAAFGGAFGAGSEAALARLFRTRPQAAPEAGPAPAMHGPEDQPLYREAAAAREADLAIARQLEQDRIQGLVDERVNRASAGREGFARYAENDTAFQQELERRRAEGLEFELRPTPASRFGDYAARDAAVQAEVADAAAEAVPETRVADYEALMRDFVERQRAAQDAERNALAERLGMQRRTAAVQGPTPQTVPERMLGTEPAPARPLPVEEQDPNWATPEARAFQGLIPTSMLRPGSPVARRREGNATADVLRRLFDRGKENVEAAAPPPPRVETPTLQPNVANATGRLKVLYEVDGDQLQVDPAAYQFKESDSSGVNGALRGVTQWNPSSPPIMVHRRADGSLYVADGHQRVAKWKELRASGQQPPPLRAEIYDEAQGFDIPTMRRIASLKNMGEGSATSIDIAKLLRTGPLAPEEAARLPRGRVAGPALEEGEALAGLSDQAFSMVVNRELDPKWGAILSRTVPPDTQMAVGRALAQSNVSNDVEAQAFVNEMLRDDFVQIAMTDLFGESIQQVSLAEKMAKIAGRVSASLGRQRRAFGGAVKNAQSLSQEGNVLATDRNAQRAQEADELQRFFNLFSGQSGSNTRETMKRIAAAVTKGEAKLDDAFDQILPALRADVAAFTGRGGPDGTPGGGARIPTAAAEPGAGPGGTGQLLPPAAAPPGANAAAEQPPVVTRADLEAQGQGGLFGDESGRVSGELASTLAGGAVGGLAGAATPGEDATTEDRLAAGALGALAGAGGGAALGRAMRGRAPASAVGQAVQGAKERGVDPAALEAALGRVKQVQQGEKVQTMTGMARGETPVVSYQNPAESIPRTKPQPAEQRATWLNLEKMPEGLRKPMQELGEEVGELAMEQQRRGRQSNARRQALASHLKTDASKILPPGTTMPAEKIEAYIDHFAAVTAHVEDLAQQVKNGAGEDVGAELMRWRTAQQAMLMSVTGLRSESGRALNVWRQMRALQPAEMRLAMEYVDRGRLRKEMSDVAELIGNLPNDPAEAVKKLAALEKSGVLEKATNYYMANILSGVGTYNRNLLGNAANMASRIAIKGTAGAGVDRLKSMLTGRERQVFAGEAMHEAAGIFYATNSALRDAFDVLRNGFSTQALEEGLQGFTELYLPKREFAGGAANPFNVPGRLLEATDRFFVQLNRSAELYGQSYAIARREAEKQGLDGKKYLDFVNERMTELRMNPSRDLRKSVNKAGDYATFREDPGEFANLLINAKKKVPALNFIVPFVRTVSNIFRQGIEHTPLTALSKNSPIYSDDAREASVAQGKMLLGSVSMLPLAYLASTGRLSGAGPKDTSKRNALFEQGWRPNSVKVSIPDGLAKKLGASKSADGEYWVNYSLFQPLSIPAAMVANLVESMQELEGRSVESGANEDIESVIAQTAMRVANTAMSQTYLQGVFSLVNALEQPERGATRWLRQVARGFSPLSGLSQSVTRAVDPVYREADTIGEDIQRITPGLSDNLRPRMDRFGRPIERTGSPLRRLGLVPEIEPTKNDRITSELERLGVTVGVPNERINLADPRTGAPGRKLTPEEGYDVRQVRGQNVRATLARIVNTPGYDRLPDYVKRDRLESAVARAGRQSSKTVRAAIRQDRPDLIRMLRDRASSQIERYEGGR